MFFCEKCGGMMLPKKIRGKTKLVCNKCGFKTVEKRKDMVIKEKINLKEKVEVVEKKIETLPKTDEECPKCGNGKAYYWLVQTRSADEAETTFYKCTKCNHTWRAY